MTDDARSLSRIVAVVAEDLDRRMHWGAGAVRQAAQALALLPEEATAAGACPVCGGVVEQPVGRGRPRKFCSSRCKDRARKSP